MSIIWKQVEHLCASYTYKQASLFAVEKMLGHNAHNSLHLNGILIVYMENWNKSITTAISIPLFAHPENSFLPAFILL